MIKGCYFVFQHQSTPRLCGVVPSDDVDEGVEGMGLSFMEERERDNMSAANKAIGLVESNREEEKLAIKARKNIQ